MGLNNSSVLELQMWYRLDLPQFNRFHFTFGYSLRWRQNGRDSISNHQPHDCLLNRLFRRRSKKTSKLRVTGLCGPRWIPRTNGQLRGKCFHLMTSLCLTAFDPLRSVDCWWLVGICFGLVCHPLNVEHEIVSPLLLLLDLVFHFSLICWTFNAMYWVTHQIFYQYNYMSDHVRLLWPASVIPMI